jgi:hypothetical protein
MGEIMLFARQSIAALSLVGAFAAQAACPSTPTANRFKLEGAELTDYKTGLVWSRCAVGRSWNGSTCTGEASLLRHEEALATAESMQGWRLPNVKELTSIADLGCTNPALDSTAFLGAGVAKAAKVLPNGSAYGYWSSTPQPDNVFYAWEVNMIDGGASWMSRDYRFAVLLVRSGP